MAGLIATTFVNLGEHREARGWFHTAQRAAEESEDPALRAWVLVRHAVSALYWNDAQGALGLATQATLVTRPCGVEGIASGPRVPRGSRSRLLQHMTTNNETPADDLAIRRFRPDDETALLALNAYGQLRRHLNG
jgi:hypothetical protein